MDYVFTFEDGSEGYLAHHGVKGMKWGVWNAETRARYSGGPRKPSVAKANLKFAAKMLGVGTAAAVAGGSFSTAGGLLGGPIGASAGMGAGIGGVLGATKQLRERAVKQRLAEIEQAKINKGKNAVAEALTGEQPAKSILELQKETLFRDNPDKGYVMTSEDLNRTFTNLTPEARKHYGLTAQKYAVELGKYDPMSKKDRGKVEDIYDKNVANWEYDSDFGTQKSAMESRAKLDVSESWRRAMDKDDWHQYTDMINSMTYENRSSKLDKLDQKIHETGEKQKAASSKYGASSKQNQSALKKYGKAKGTFESEYKKLNP